MRQFSSTDEAWVAPVSSDGGDRERSPLSQREWEIMSLVAQGFKNKEMAEKMLISEQMVKNHLHNIFDKLGVSDRLPDDPNGPPDGPAVAMPVPRPPTKPMRAVGRKLPA